MQVLVVDDSSEDLQYVVDILATFSKRFPDYDICVSTSRSYESSISICESLTLDLAIVDVMLPKTSRSRETQLLGFDLLKQFKRADPLVEVFLMSSIVNDVRTAVASVAEHDAAYYFLKDHDAEDIQRVIKLALDRRILAKRHQRLSSSPEDFVVGAQSASPLVGMIGSSKVLKETKEMIQKISKSDSTVLITGESGTGKELVAQSLHYGSSRRAEPFVAVNCASISEERADSDLFGHKKGAFTGAVEDSIGKVRAADGGTLFLDEVAELKPSVQSKLLRLLQEGSACRVGDTREQPVNVRVVAATNADFDELVDEKRFRADLLARLKVFEIQLPPLRQRGTDVIEIAEYYFRKACNNTRIIDLTDCAKNYLTQQQWPGNVRDIQSITERCVVLSNASEITGAVLAENDGFNRTIVGPTKTMLRELTRGCRDATASAEEREESREELKRLLAELLRMHGTKKSASKSVGISRQTLDNYIREAENGEPEE